MDTKLDPRNKFMFIYSQVFSRSSNWWKTNAPLLYDEELEFACIYILDDISLEREDHKLQTGIKFLRK